MSDKQNTQKPTQLKVKYDETKATYACQALVQATEEEVYLDFSSGIMQDPVAGSIMPIHTRIAMSHTAAVRLFNALGQTLQQRQDAKAKKAATPTK